MKTGFWLRDARKHLFTWRNCSSLQNISALSERTRMWRNYKIKIQSLTTFSRHGYSSKDSQVWRTSVQHSVELVPCARFHSTFRSVVHKAGLASKRVPDIKASTLSSMSNSGFSSNSRYMPACILSPKKFIAEEIADLARDFHTSSRVLALPIPLLWILLKPLKKLTAMLLGRSIRKWWQALPPDKQELLKDTMKRNRWSIVLGICSLSSLIAIYFWTHLDKSPITGRNRLLMFSKRQFLQLAEFEYQSVLENYKDKFLPVTDPMYETTQFVFNQLIEKNKDIPGVSETKWSINVVEDPEINAFVMPYMFDRPYSRKLEIEADEVGLRLAAKACTDVRASSVYWQQLELMKIVSGTFQIPEWFSTHPSNDHRVEHLDKLIPKAIKLREDCGCPSLSSVDPRLVFRLSVQEMLKLSKKKEESFSIDSGIKQLPQYHEPRTAIIERLPTVVSVQALQSTQNTHK
ncbi:metalloendopeptidase OMA1, mitochondrial isoform X4 [Scyliorhinus torazame]|uniref:metalloendopeptidase OMA1, mitochondrial isoform X4 n=1 Tax=Scyliorhinus torazame TaxID=75743 RepID=UPI003B5B8C1C